MPQEYGGAGLGMTEAALMMQTIAASGAGFTGASARRAACAMAGAADRRPREGLLRRDRAGRRAGHHQAVHAGRPPGRRVCGAWPQDLDLDGAGRQQDAAAGAHHAAVRGGQAHAGAVAVLYRSGP
ncbi:hypothetical protein G6F31_019879 [Rhizopus arrhizus]|nr:hypothetical protein G6F31_019879 [Rhizopus arrhizus]